MFNFTTESYLELDNYIILLTFTVSLTKDGFLIHLQTRFRMQLITPWERVGLNNKLPSVASKHFIAIVVQEGKTEIICWI